MVSSLRDQPEKTEEINVSEWAGYPTRAPLSKLDFLMLQEKTRAHAAYGETPSWRPSQVPEPAFARSIQRALLDVILREIVEARAAAVPNDLGREISLLRQEVENISRELRCRPVVKPVALVDLGAGTLILRQPIQIVIEEYEDEVTASWPETEAFGSGDTESEAILALKRDIASLYDDLMSTSDSELGTLALGWKRTLGRLISTDDASQLHTSGSGTRDQREGETPGATGR